MNEKMKQIKIMILTSYYTGHGHASIANALSATLDEYKIEYVVVESLNLSWRIIRRLCKQYGKVTNKVPWFWGLYFKFIHNHHTLTNRILKIACKRKFLSVVKKHEPDVVVSVHPMFVGCILDIIEEKELDIKFHTIIADLVSINRLWVDKRSDLIFCPTVESLAFAKNIVLREDKLKKSTIPTRREINEVASQLVLSEQSDEQADVNCIIMSGGEGSGDMERIVEALLEHPKTNITVVTGRNKRLYKKLHIKYQMNERVTVCGFVKEIYDLIPKHDIAIVRASPNVLMECINLLMPIITTGYLPGQEKGNDKWIQAQGLGLICNKPSELVGLIDKYITNDRELLKEIRNNQSQYRELAAANQIIDTIMQYDK